MDVCIRYPRVVHHLSFELCAVDPCKLGRPPKSIADSVCVVIDDEELRPERFVAIRFGDPGSISNSLLQYYY